MLNRIVRTRVIVIASLSLLTIGVVVGVDNHPSATSHTSATAQHQLAPTGGVFGWD